MRAFDPVGDLQQRRIILRRVDDERKWQAFTGARQRGQVETEDLQARHAFQLGLDLWQDFHLGSAAFVPGLEQEAADTRLYAVVAVDLERGVVLRELLEDGNEVIGVRVQVVEVGWLRGAGHHEDDALVLVGGQFGLGEHDQHRDQQQDDHGEHQYHRPGVERAVKHALVTALQALENHVQPMGQARGVLIVAQQHGAHHR